MGVLLQVRDVDEAVRDELKSRAATEGKSLNAYLQTLLIEAVATPTRSQVIDRILARSETSALSSVEIVRDDRDARSAPSRS
ncbi:MAG: FitA-like ribbon-helix-helix domain-containing protein [Ornithinimicrobium sp.]|jgi:plasmid stability protein|uniref:FitA-like ribbon-helix-helix domain-containing protein n=1 Tax=Ornithinimicrobium sp. TaxID=1977084 RepID=UPI0017CCC9E9|nr:hypothetical protein [Actinomycetota bacterium]